MRLVDAHGNQVLQTLKAIEKALCHTMVVTASEGADSITLMEQYTNGDLIHVVRDKITGETRFENPDEAYMRFRFLVEADFQVCLPFL